MMRRWRWTRRGNKNSVSKSFPRVPVTYSRLDAFLDDGDEVDDEDQQSAHIRSSVAPEHDVEDAQAVVQAIQQRHDLPVRNEKSRERPEQGTNGTDRSLFLLPVKVRDPPLT